MKLSETQHFVANVRGRDGGADIQAPIFALRTAFRWIFRSVAGFLWVGGELVPQEGPCCHGLGLAWWAQVGMAPIDRAMRCQALA